MSYKIHPKEIEAVSVLPAPERYGHFIRRVADWQEVWGLASESGWCQMKDDDGNLCIPFWPHPAYAEAMALHAWSGNKPKLISLSDFLSKWLPGMARDDLRAAVFVVPRGGGAMIVGPLQLKEDLEAECEQYE